jgi:peptide/nickel transport system substrate-binding protein
MIVVQTHRHAPRRTARAFVAITAIGVVMSALAGVGSATTSGRVAHQKSGGDITFGVENETESANGFCLPRSQLAISGIQEVAAVYDTLTIPNSKGEYTPYLAKSVTPNADFTQWTITLRPGIKFHDGTPLDAAAVKLNLDTYGGAPGAPQPAPLFGNITKPFQESVDIVDPLTVRVNMKQPVPQYPSALWGVGRVGIVAPAQLNAGEACSGASAGSRLIGTGPFVCKPGCWRPGESLTLEKNPDYWQKGYPKADKITFFPVPEQAQRLTELRSGELDIEHLDNAQQIVQLDRMRSDFNLLVQKPGLREIRYYFFNSAKPPFDDHDARLALAYAVDRSEINQIINKNLFQLADGVMDSKSPGYLRDAGIPKHNLKKARALVDKYKADHGGTFDVRILADTSDTSNVNEAQLIQQELEKAGISVTLPPAANQASFINDAIAGNFGIFLWRNLHGGATKDIDFDLSPWFFKDSLVNFGRIDDPKLEQALQEGRNAADLKSINRAYQTVNRVISENAYILPMWYVDWTIGSAKNVKVTFPKLPDGAGTPLFVYGRIPVLGLSKS